MNYVMKCINIFKLLIIFFFITQKFDIILIVYLRSKIIVIYFRISIFQSLDTSLPINGWRCS